LKRFEDFREEMRICTRACGSPSEIQRASADFAARRDCKLVSALASLRRALEEFSAKPRPSRPREIIIIPLKYLAENLNPPTFGKGKNEQSEGEREREREKEKRNRRKK